jgi:hypothetical protein
MFFIILLITIIWFMLPLVPSIQELLIPTDTDPLKVVPRDTGDISFFARNFRKYILSQLQKYDFSVLSDYEPAKLSDGTPFVRVQGTGQLPLQENSIVNTVDHVVIAGTGTILQDDTTFLREVYGMKSFIGGVQCIYRAILSEEDLTLSAGSTVLRWAHSVGLFTIGENSLLYGRASSDKELHLAPGVTFEWIAAPLISVGTPGEPHGIKGIMKETVKRIPFELDETTTMAGDTHRHEGDLLIRGQRLVSGNLIVTGRLDIMPGSCVQGNIKAYKEVTIGDKCIVQGSIVTKTVLTVGTECILWGPLVSEQEINVGYHSTVGTTDKPTTIVAPIVALYPGVAISGMVIAQNTGQVFSKTQQGQVPEI